MIELVSSVLAGLFACGCAWHAARIVIDLRRASALRSGAPMSPADIAAAKVAPATVVQVAGRVVERVGDTVRLRDERGEIDVDVGGARWVVAAPRKGEVGEALFVLGRFVMTGGPPRVVAIDVSDGGPARLATVHEDAAHARIGPTVALAACAIVTGMLPWLLGAG